MNFLESFCSIGLSFEYDGFRLAYSLITTFVFIMCTMFCREYFAGAHAKKRFYTFWIITYLAVIGLLFSGDFFTLFMFFEIMSFASTFWVLHEEDEGSDYAGRLYLRISVICGLVMLYGIFMVQHIFGTVSFEEISLATSYAGFSLTGEMYAAAFMLFVGFGAKAGAFLLHVWLPRAHTVAPAPASAVLSGILTKTGIMGIIITSTVLNLMNNETWGTFLMLMGAATMFTGAFLAIFSTNLKKTLACSSVSQIGFILTGIACMVLLADDASALASAYSGTLLHMVNHSLIKLVLFLLAGGVLKKTGSLSLNDIKGYGRNKPYFAIPFAIGALSISGIPGFSGYVSKTLIHEAVEEISGNTAASVTGVIFTITGGMTLCYMTKLFVCLFVEKGPASEKEGLKPLSLVSVWIPALILFVMGIIPGLFTKIPETAILNETGLVSSEFGEVAEMEWFAFHTMKGGLISICIGIVLYFVVVRLLLMKKTPEGYFYRDGLPKWFDLEKYIYRPVILYALPFVLAIPFRFLDRAMDMLAFFLRKKVLNPLRHKAKGSGGSYYLGNALDFITGRRKNGKQSFTGKLALQGAETAELFRILERSISFSMLLFALGLVITLIYMLH